jgi:hypothetical protein
MKTSMSFSLLLILFPFFAGCSGDKEIGKDCWAHPYELAAAWGEMDFNLKYCQAIGSDGGETIYRCACPPDGCQCADSPSSDGGDQRYDCRWAREYYYEGPVHQGPGGGSCTCLECSPCWQVCKGKSSPDGGMTCKMGGKLLPCQATPDLDEFGQVWICGRGNVPFDKIDGGILLDAGIICE